MGDFEAIWDDSSLPGGSRAMSRGASSQNGGSSHGDTGASEVSMDVENHTGVPEGSRV